MYCTVNEAFDNPLKQQMEQLINENNIKNYRGELGKNIESYQQKYGLNPPHTIDPNKTPNYNPSNEIYPDANLDFFTTQGNYTKNNNDISGTKISDLRRDENKYYDDMSILDSNYSDMFKSEEKHQYSHNHYINKFFNSIIDDPSDVASMASSQDDELYDHIKKCKYCRTQINKKMKLHYNKKNKIVKKKNSKIIKNIKSNDKIFGYDVKEIIIIIVISVIIIFILDLLVKIGKKSMNN